MRKFKWTTFWDMHSGGSQKEDYSIIYIEAPLKEAKVIFYNRFDHSPDRVTCICCGEDYSISESDSLDQASGYHRNCKWGKEDKRYIEEQVEPNFGRLYQTVDQHINSNHIFAIFDKDIKENERIGELPEEGYVWMD